MEIKIDFTRSAQDNANSYYQKAKRLAHKREGAEKALKELGKRLKGEKEMPQEVEKRKIMKLEKKEWYEKFHWFFTSNGMLAIGGRDAHQNEILFSKYFDENDLFFHADVFGASVVILKDGTNAQEDVKQEVAQFAASYSRAWQNMLKSVDVYALRKAQVSKSTSKGSLGTGSFLMKGEREWYRNTTLALVAFVRGGKFNMVPRITFEELGQKGINVIIMQGEHKKSDIAKQISKELNYNDTDTIMRQLPVGGISINKNE
jgi:predicted ribosome quality control (RQC) complex YloA/Tae2 family protein